MSSSGARISSAEVQIGDTVTVGPEFSLAPARDDYESGRKPPQHFLERAKRIFPNLELADLSLDFAGIMVHLRGGGDWVIRRDRATPTACSCSASTPPASSARWPSPAGCGNCCWGGNIRASAGGRP